ncbi:DUF2149 domain-containing protein [Phyllobacterium phragmitis]|uniref:DUF2149 domain-containing protein n=1 Tax=Phyllobacterium phragmitis TaxID=2670329 RepID=A0ABQ0H3E8_9HYPH
MRFLDHDDSDDPILSVVNLIDLFLVVIGILMITIVTNPLNPFSSEKVTVIENPGEADMRITVKDGRELTRFEANGKIGEGQGSAPASPIASMTAAWSTCPRTPASQLSDGSCGTAKGDKACLPFPRQARPSKD